jgi:hypothetical protein
MERSGGGRPGGWRHGGLAAALVAAGAQVGDAAAALAMACRLGQGEKLEERSG